jgi:hypothetical protein
MATIGVIIHQEGHIPFASTNKEIPTRLSILTLWGNFLKITYSIDHPFYKAGMQEDKWKKPTLP